MARLAVAVTVFFFVITLSHARIPISVVEDARIPVDLTENDVTKHELATDLTESDSKITTNMIFLPSHKTESESEPEPEDVTVKHAVNEPELEKSESDSSDSKTTTSFEPVTVINFRSINRHFHRRPSLLFRRRRPCRHHALQKPWGPGILGRSWFENLEVPYGNDMLTASDGGEIKADRLRVYRGDGRVKLHKIPARWVNFHDGYEPKFSLRHEDDLTVMKRKEDEFKRPGHDQHRHHHRDNHHHHEEGEKPGHQGGFLMKIRKFLTHF